MGTPAQPSRYTLSTVPVMMLAGAVALLLGFAGRFVLFVTVLNGNGEPCDFSAEATLDLGTVDRYGGQPQPRQYWAPVAWEETFNRTINIGYRTRSRLFVAECFRDPRTFWFRVPEIAAWNKAGHGRGWVWEPIDDKAEFDIEIVNHTAEQSITKRGIITWRGDGSIGFTLAHA